MDNTNERINVGDVVSFINCKNVDGTDQLIGVGVVYEIELVRKSRLSGGRSVKPGQTFWVKWFDDVKLVPGDNHYRVDDLQKIA